MIDRATVEKIKETADIVEVVSDYVHLVKRGANYMGLCPFHNERTPSFSVSPRRNFCYCFSCHKGGSPVNFIMEKEGISYHDALLQLANKYGIKVEERELTDEEQRARSEREAMLVANEWAMRRMQQWMTDTDEGRTVGLQYLYQRGVTDEAIRTFRLGYSPDKGSALSDAAHNDGYSEDVLKKTGLLGTSQQGRTYDRFRGRVIFPILNSGGKVIAFGGRDLKGGPAKYINSPESDIYRKSNELYGIYQAKNEIVRRDKCYLVEGYLDVIGMWMAGMQNTVASSGTALTDGQIALIHRFTNHVTLVYDGDAAGIKASLRGIDMLLSHKLDVRLVLLPDGDDPDSFARKHSPEEMRKYFDDNEVDIIRFKTRILMQDSDGDPERRTAAIRSVVESLGCIPDDIKRNVYIQECSSLLGVSEDIVLAETDKARRRNLEKWRKERARAEWPDRTEEHGPVPADERNGNQAPGAGSKDPSHYPQPPTSVTATSQQLERLFPLAPFEYALTRLAVLYGMLDFCEGVDQDGNATQMSVMDFIECELTADNIQFTVDTCRRTVDIVKSMREEFDQSIERYYTSLLPDLDRQRREGYEAIAARGLDSRSIATEEEKLNAAVDENCREKLREFAMRFVSDRLASHQDDDIRRLTIGFLTEKWELKRSRSQQPVSLIERDALHLDEIVPRAITELKDALLREQLAGLGLRLARASEAGDEEEQRSVQSEMLRIMQLRSQVAKAIGDRVILPR